MCFTHFTSSSITSPRYLQFVTQLISVVPILRTTSSLDAAPKMVEEVFPRIQLNLLAMHHSFQLCRWKFASSAIEICSNYTKWLYTHKLSWTTFEWTLFQCLFRMSILTTWTHWQFARTWSCVEQQQQHCFIFKSHYCTRMLLSVCWNTMSMSESERNWPIGALHARTRKSKRMMRMTGRNYEEVNCRNWRGTEKLKKKRTSMLASSRPSLFSLPC
jgi:hypothetical protein